MKAIKKIIVGSYVFFNNYEDYKSKDKDVIAIMDSFIPNHNSMNMKLSSKNEDVFMYRNLTKELFIQDTITSGVPMRVGKFLVPEFNEYIGFTIDDLLLLEPIFELLDTSHKYLKIIYDAYIENQSFTLTDEQRLKAYKEYKKERV